MCHKPIMIYISINLPTRTTFVQEIHGRMCSCGNCGNSFLVVRGTMMMLVYANKQYHDVYPVSTPWADKITSASFSHFQLRFRICNFIFCICNFVFCICNFGFCICNFVFCVCNFVFGICNFIFNMRDLTNNKNILIPPDYLVVWATALRGIYVIGGASGTSAD